MQIQAGQCKASLLRRGWVTIWPTFRRLVPSPSQAWSAQKPTLPLPQFILPLLSPTPVLAKLSQHKCTYLGQHGGWIQSPQANTHPRAGPANSQVCKNMPYDLFATIVKTRHMVCLQHCVEHSGFVDCALRSFNFGVLTCKKTCKICLGVHPCGG